MGKNYYHMALNSNRKKDINNLKKQLEELQVTKPTEDEIFELLMAKNDKIIISPTEVKKIIGRKRGINL